ncbi:MAG: TerB family tellurite resistance protein [Rhodothermales bacterium]|nr:TerB family tellurite resistance protein [Rhodothermales bacterium]
MNDYRLDELCPYKMTPADETWTRTHELALVYLALAYGTDHALVDEEMETIVETIQGWDRTLSKAGAQELVLEALAVYLQENATVEVTRTIRALKSTLSEDERRHALEDIVRIAEADGVLLSSESSLIATLADIWGLRETGARLLAQTTATVVDEPAWSLLHDMALICIVLAHSTDNNLSLHEIGAILERLGAWQPDLSKEALHEVFRGALQAYSTQPDREVLTASTRSIREALPPIQRIAFLDDLLHVARADGHVNQNEEAMLHALSKGWSVDIRLTDTRVGAD